MTAHIDDEWSGEKGRKSAKFFASRARRIIERTIFGNYWTSFNNELEKQISTGSELIVDIGGGSGNFSIPIAKKLTSGKITCIDPSSEMTDHLLLQAKELALEKVVEIKNLSALETGFPDNHFDWAVCGNVMHELATPELAFKEIYRILKPGSNALIVDFRNWHGYHGGDSHGPFSVQEFEQLFTQAGFQEIEVKKKRHFVVGTAKK